jgi:hypothetical protein
MQIVGIDPGLSGALALLDDETLVALNDMPTFDIMLRKARRRDLDGQAICARLNDRRLSSRRRRSRGKALMRPESSFRSMGSSSAF